MANPTINRFWGQILLAPNMDVDNDHKSLINNFLQKKNCHYEGGI